MMSDVSTPHTIYLLWSSRVVTTCAWLVEAHRTYMYLGFDGPYVFSKMM